MKITSRTIIIRYGLGCVLHPNCFKCGEEKDCNTKGKFNGHAIMTDESIIYGENPEIIKMRYRDKIEK